MGQSGVSLGSVGQAIEHQPVSVQIEQVELEGYLSVPTAASGVVLFAHGSGSSRHSPRNRYVADLLNESGLATLLIDLLTADEQEVDRQTAQLRFDIPFLAKRLVKISEWLKQHPEIPGLKLGHFGASTGAGGALLAAAAAPELVQSVVSRGGRPDLAGAALPRVQAPTLLIVGGDDHVVLEMNREAMARMRCRKELRIVPGASHLFEEPGTLKKAATLARDWFLETLK
ncbi:MAG TPA: dienelactone hydrolase family protein [Bryobacteraceae bacterium]|nr:dienelactone hydrolase family protein [Bryobacteraceae bacterium]